MDEESDILDDKSNLREYLRVLRRRKWVVIITTLVAVGITLAYSLNQPLKYTSTAYVQVPPPGGDDPLEGLNASGLTVDQQRTLMENETTFARSDPVRRTARKRLGERADYKAEPVVNSSVLAIRGVSDNPQDAARIANTVSRAYLDESLADQTASLRRAIINGRRSTEALLDQLRSLPSGAPGRNQVYLAASNLQGQVARAKARLELTTDSGGRVRAYAVKPKNPTEPKTTRNVAVAAVLGLIAGIALAFMIDRLDDRVRTKRDVDIASRGVPSLGLIPWSSSWSDAKVAHLITMAEPQSSTSEAFRTLRTSVEILGLSSPIRTLAVTSAEPSEGKSATAANLAVVLARAEHRVAVVCCDFRKPRLHEYFGLANDTGFTSILVGEVTLDQALEPVDGVPNLAVLPSGPLPPNPSELLSLRATAEILTALSGRFDYVILDCPPVLPVPDALVVGRLVDGMIVVTMAKRTTKRRLERALELLDQVQSPVLGTVFTGVTRAEGYGYEQKVSAYGDEGMTTGLRRALRRRGGRADASTSTGAGHAPPAPPAAGPTNGHSSTVLVDDSDRPPFA